jgi:hypothetical protein
VRSTQHRDDLFTARAVVRTDVVEVFGHLRGGGPEDFTAERGVGGHVSYQMVGWEQLGASDRVADSQWNGVALPTRQLDDDHGCGRTQGGLSLV